MIASMWRYHRITDAGETAVKEEAERLRAAAAVVQQRVERTPLGPAEAAALRVVQETGTGA